MQGGTGFCVICFSSPSKCQKQGKWKHKNKNSVRLCTMHYDTGLYSDGCEEKIAIDEAVF